MVRAPEENVEEVPRDVNPRLTAPDDTKGSRRHSRRRLDLAPDLLMVEAEDRIRTAWSIAREGKPPQFVLDVVTKLMAPA